MKSLLLISIGPVQDFIAAARRCQDLWYGSWLLSDLSRAVAESLQRSCGDGALIFPAGLADSRRPAIANKVLAVVPDGTEPAVAAKQAQKALAARLEGHAREAMERAEQRWLHRRAAMAQVSELIEFVWASVPLGETDTEYEEARKAVEQLLGARKNTKLWSQVSHDAPDSELQAGWVPKSAIDGQRESVIAEAAYREFASEPRRAYEAYRIRHDERICGVGLLKRLGQEVVAGTAAEDESAEGEERRDGRPSLVAAQRYPVQFHSTSHVAAGPWRTRFARVGEVAEEAFREYLRALGELGIEAHRIREKRAHVARSPFDPGLEIQTPGRLPGLGRRQGYDAYLAYESRLPEIIEEFADVRDPRAALARVVPALRRLVAVVGAEPTRYYGFLLADGDHMGSTIEQLGRMGAHRRLSRALDEFASGARDIVDQHGGSLVYAGGDDVLALVPLHTALRCARQLHDDFAAKLAPATAGATRAPTLSIGLGVVHHLMDLTAAREIAKRAEALAKRRVDATGAVVKDALGIVVSKRSGPDLEWVRGWGTVGARDERGTLGSWTLPGRSDGPDGTIEAWCRLYRGEAIPDKAAYDVLEAIAPFELRSAGTADAGADANMIASLVKRVLARKRHSRGVAELGGGFFQKLEDRFGPDPLRGARELATELQVSRVFLQAYEMAFGDLAGNEGRQSREAV